MPPLVRWPFGGRYAGLRGPSLSVSFLAKPSRSSPNRFVPSQPLHFAVLKPPVGHSLCRYRASRGRRPFQSSLSFARALFCSSLQGGLVSLRRWWSGAPNFLDEGGDLIRVRDIPNSEPHEREIDKAFREQRGAKVYGNPKEGEPGAGKQPDRLIGDTQTIVEYKKVSNQNSVRKGGKDAVRKEGTEEIVFYIKDQPNITEDMIRRGIADAGRKVDVSLVKKWWIYDGVILRVWISWVREMR